MLVSDLVRIGREIGKVVDVAAPDTVVRLRSAVAAIVLNSSVVYVRLRKSSISALVRCGSVSEKAFATNAAALWPLLVVGKLPSQRANHNKASHTSLVANYPVFRMAMQWCSFFGLPASCKENW